MATNSVDSSASMYELSGGAPGMQKLAAAFYARMFADPLMVPLFRDPDEDHVGRMALWLGEFFGGPAVHSEQRGGISTVIMVHRGLNISDAQRQHWIDHMLAASHEVGLPEVVMDAFLPHIHFGARAAQGESRGRRFR